MTEETSFGVRRLRQAIANQATCGSGQFELSIDSADRLCREIEDELTRLAWAHGVPAPVDADGNVVPLTTKVMYTNRGRKIELREFYLLHSVLSGGFVWRAIRHVGRSVEDLKLDFLHLHRPDSWALLEKDVFTLAVCKHLADPESDAKECIRRAKALAGVSE